MLDAMISARVGDDVFKMDESVNTLEKKIAHLFGKDSALFFPSGTMANQTAIKVHTQPGEQLICDKYAHIYNYEGGGVSFNSGVSCKLIDGYRGMFTATQVETSINPPDFYHSPLTSLVCIENTSNKAGGACWNFSEIKKIREVCNKHQLKLHLDGARLWNALVAKSESAKQYGEVFDTISVCLSKGLGCPVGSLLIGSNEIIKKALRVRKILGGGMRQSGYLAAAGIYALNNHINRLEEDHQKAKEIGVLLKSLSFVSKVEEVETNIVIFYLNKNIDELTFINNLKEKNVHILSMGDGKLRIVTHHDYTDEMHHSFFSILKKIEKKL
jgi:threonine aldolase